MRKRSSKRFTKEIIIGRWKWKWDWENGGSWKELQTYPHYAKNWYKVYMRL